MNSLRLKRPTHRAKHWCELVAGSPRMRTCAYKIRAHLLSWLAASTSCGISSGWRSKGILWMTLSSSAVTSLSDLEVTPKVTHDGWSSFPSSSPTYLGACNVLSFLGQHQCSWVVQCWNNLEGWWTLELGK